MYFIYKQEKYIKFYKYLFRFFIIKFIYNIKQ